LLTLTHSFSLRLPVSQYFFTDSLIIDVYKHMFRLFDPAPYDLYCVGGTLSLTQSIIDPAISRDYTSESDVHWRRFYFHLTCVHSAL